MTVYHALFDACEKSERDAQRISTRLTKVAAKLYNHAQPAHVVNDVYYELIAIAESLARDETRRAALRMARHATQEMPDCDG